MKEVKSIRLGQKEGYFCKKIAVGSFQKLDPMKVVKSYLHESMKEVKSNLRESMKVVKSMRH